MAEIRSTLEMVMERAAKLCNTDEDDSDSFDQSQEGMRTGAAMLRGDKVNISEKIETIAPAARHTFIKGLTDTFMRNIVLPRDEESTCEDAFAGLLEIDAASESDGKVSGLIDEIRSILPRYIDHKKQLRHQLEENFASQMGQVEDNLAQQTGVSMKLEPSQHPQFAKEWQNVTSSLIDQYGNALEQYKTAIIQQLTGQFN